MLAHYQLPSGRRQTEHDLLKFLGGFWGSKFGGYQALWKCTASFPSSELITTLSSNPLQSKTPDRENQGQQAPHLSEGSPMKERCMISASIQELTDMMSSASLETLIDIRFGIRQLIVSCKRAQAERLHTAQRTAASIVIPTADNDNSLKRKKDWLVTLHDRKQQKRQHDHRLMLVPVKPSKHKLGKKAVADGLRAPKSAAAKPYPNPAAKQSKATYKEAPGHSCTLPIPEGQVSWRHPEVNGEILTSCTSQRQAHLLPLPNHDARLAIAVSLQPVTSSAPCDSINSAL